LPMLRRLFAQFSSIGEIMESQSLRTRTRKFGE
jgi:hypothetical protein